MIVCLSAHIQVHRKHFKIDYLVTWIFGDTPENFQLSNFTQYYESKEGLNLTRIKVKYILYKQDCKVAALA